jgi:hypothetical protein
MGYFKSGPQITDPTASVTCGFCMMIESSALSRSNPTAHIYGYPFAIAFCIRDPAEVGYQPTVHPPLPCVLVFLIEK